MRQALVGGLACVLITTLLAGCSANSAATATIAHGVSIAIPAGSTSFSPRADPVPDADASLLSTVSFQGMATGPSPFVALATPVQLSATGPFPKNGVDLIFHVDPKAVPRGTTPFIATYDAADAEWTPTTSTYTPATGTVRAHISHFSIWGIFSFLGSAVKTLARDVFHSLFGSIKVTDPAPTCGDSTGLTSTIQPPNGDLEVCTQNGPNNEATLKVKSYLSFPIDVDTAKGMQVSVGPPGGLFTQIGGYLNNLSTGKSRGTLIAAGSEADVTFPLAAGTSATVLSDLDMTAYLAGIIDSGVNVLTVMENRLGAHPKAALDAISQGKCAAELGQVSFTSSPVSATTLKALTQVAFDCASTVVDLGATGIVQGIIATVAGLIENILQSAFALAMVVVGGPSGTKATVEVTRTTAVPVSAPCTATALAAGAGLNLDTSRIDAFFCANSEAIFQQDLYAIEGDKADVYLQSTGTDWKVVQGAGTSTQPNGLPASFNALSAGYASAQSQAQAEAQSAYNSDLAVVQGYTDSGTFPSGTYSDCGSVAGASGSTTSLPDFYGDPSGYHVIIGCGPTGDNSFAFFFQGTHFLGTDTAQPSQNISVQTRTASTVTIAYAIYNPGDPASSPTGGTVDVVFNLSGDQVVPGSPIPPVESDTGSGTPGR